jgi:hypothetical protein
VFSVEYENGIDCEFRMQILLQCSRAVVAHLDVVLQQQIVQLVHLRRGLKQRLLLLFHLGDDANLVRKRIREVKRQEESVSEKP